MRRGANRGARIRDPGPALCGGVRSKARHRGQAREDFVLETVYWTPAPPGSCPACCAAVPGRDAAAARRLDRGLGF